MSFGTIFNLGGGEIILVLAVILFLFGAGKFPTLAKCFEAIPSLWKAKRKTRAKLGKLADSNLPQEPNHPLLMGITFVLGAACLGLVLYEILK